MADNGSSLGSEEDGHRLMRYAMDVVATSVVEVVSCAGGWLYDRATAGWDVTVLLAAQPDVRPLHILGAKVVDLRDALAGPPRRPAAIAAAVALYEADLGVRDEIHAAVVGGRVEVTLWGQNCPRELSRCATDTTHELSWAARIFKTQALSAAAAPAELVPPFETFHTLARDRRAVVSNLLAESLR